MSRGGTAASVGCPEKGEKDGKECFCFAKPQREGNLQRARCGRREKNWDWQKREGGIDST